MTKLLIVQIAILSTILVFLCLIISFVTTTIWGLHFLDYTPMQKAVEVFILIVALCNGIIIVKSVKIYYSVYKKNYKQIWVPKKENEK